MNPLTLGAPLSVVVLPHPPGAATAARPAVCCLLTFSRHGGQRRDTPCTRSTPARRRPDIPPSARGSGRRRGGAAPGTRRRRRRGRSRGRPSFHFLGHCGPCLLSQPSWSSRAHPHFGQAPFACLPSHSGLRFSLLTWAIHASPSFEAAPLVSLWPDRHSPGRSRSGFGGGRTA